MIQVQKFPSQNKIFIENIEQGNSELIDKEPHSHNFWEIGYFENGGGMHSIDFIEIPIKDKMLYFLKKGVVHNMHRDKNSFGKVVMFDENVVGNNVLYDKLFYAEPHLAVDTELFLFFKQLFIQLEFQLSNYKKNNALSVKYLELLLEFYAQYCENKIQATSKLQDFLLFVELHYSAKLTVEMCIETMNISYQQLYHEAKLKLNKSPMDIIKERTILQAKRLLFNTEDSIKEIAYQLDFDDASYFSKYFKLETGRSPIEFRNQERKKIT